MKQAFQKLFKDTIKVDQVRFYYLLLFLISYYLFFLKKKNEKKKKKKKMEYEITHIERIENEKLWNKYATEKRLMYKKLMDYQREFSDFNPDILTTQSNWMELCDSNFPLESEVNEVFLFHNTKMECISIIKETGVELALGNIDGQFEPGIQFNEDPTLNHNHSFDSTTSHYNLFICRVLLGEAKTVTVEELKTKKAPPLMNGSTQRYDSIVGDEKGPRQFVIYNGYQAYPEFLVSYTLK